MATIQAKHGPKIQKGSGLTYDPATFKDKYKQPNFFEVLDPDDILSSIKPFDMDGRKFITFDTETHPCFTSSQDIPEGVVRRWVGTGKKAVPQDYPFCISICDGVNSFTIFDSPENNFELFKRLWPLFEDPSIEKIAHNAKYDMHMLHNIGMKIVGRLHDTVVLAKLIDENRNSFTLRDIASKLDGGITIYEDMVDTYKQMHKVAVYTMIPRELLCEYANADVWNCALAFKDNFAKLEEYELTNLYDNECELMVALYAMERYGMALDVDYEVPLKRDLQKLADEAEASIYITAGKMFNINSSKQLYEVLLACGVAPTLIGLTPKGNPKLDKNALNTLANVHGVDIVQQILDYRKYEKLLTTYADGIYAQRDCVDKVHGSINQTEATTGRMSITKPALQTLPKKDTRIRRAFIPSEGFSLWFMDLDQVEYRLFAHYAKIPTLLESIRNGHDVHGATAALLYHKDLDKLLRDVHAGDPEANALRSKAKTINFALIYGVGQDHLAEMLGCSSTAAAVTKSDYFAAMPEARLFINTVYSVIKSRGYVRNFYGRRRRLVPDDCYKAPNALIQGCAADYIKYRVVKIYKYLKYHNLSTRLINIVHDELVIEAAVGEEMHLPVLRTLLSEFEEFRCPITAGCECGRPSWGEKYEPEDIGFKQPDTTAFMSYDVYNGSVFNI